MKRLLLGSGGFSTPERMEHWRRALDAFLGPVEEVLFVPYALADHDGYVAKLIERGFHGGRRLVGIHTKPDPRAAIENAQAIYIGGGNTFRLLHDLYRHDLLEPIRRRVAAGLPYIGVSAGTNVSTPTIKTTNDMPIVMPPSFDALGLVSFQINPHYFPGVIHFREGEGFTAYAGETRDDRLREFHEMNETPVLGLWEGTILEVGDRGLGLKGMGGARLFRRGQLPRDLAIGEVFSI